MNAESDEARIRAEKEITKLINNFYRMLGKDLKGCDALDISELMLEADFKEILESLLAF